MSMADDATKKAEGVAEEAKDTASSVAQSANAAAQGVSANAKDTLDQLKDDLSGLRNNAAEETAQQPLDSDTSTPIVQEIEMEPVHAVKGSKKSPGFFTVFGILLLVGSLLAMGVGCYYGFIPSSILSCRKHVPCDDGYERIPTTVGQTSGFQTLYKGETAAPDITSWSYGATSGSNIA